MKKYVSRALLTLLVTIGTVLAADAQIVVKIRPGVPVMKVRPMAPSNRHVWVSGDYVWRGNQYVWNDGYWAAPPAYGHRWVEGHWKKRRGGWVWIPGHWRK